MHRLPALPKLVGTVVLVAATVAVPRGIWWPFVPAGLLAGGAVVAAGAAHRATLRRFAVELPFLVFAALQPFTGSGPTVRVLGLTLHREGLAAAGSLAAKATIGVAAAVALAASTPVPALLDALRRLRVPRALLAVLALLARYLGVVVGEADRMRVARLARGDDPRWLWQAGGVASGLGALFVRSVGRAERVTRAIEARGGAGGLPLPPPPGRA